MPQRDIGPEYEFLNKLQAVNPNWKMTYKDYLGGSQPQYESGGADFLTWEGSGGDSDVMKPTIHMPYKPPGEMPSMYSPEQLGWSALDANMLRSRGVNGLPAYMQKERIYSPGVSLEGDDPLQMYLESMKTPTDAGGGGKRESAVNNMGWNASPEGMSFVGAPGNVNDIATQSFAPEGEAPQWGGGEQAQFAKDFLRRKWKPNTGTLKETVLPAATGISAILAPILGLSAAGAFAAPAAGAAAGGAAGGSVAADTLAPLTASQISAEFPAMAGTSLAGSELAATPGYFGSGIGAAGGADAALGGMYGTGVGLEGAAMSNAPVQSTGKTPGDFLADKAKGAARNYAIKKGVGALMPEQEMPEASGGGYDGETAPPIPHIESGYYNRFTGERLSPEEFFRMHGKAQSAR